MYQPDGDCDYVLQSTLALGPHQRNLHVVHALSATSSQHVKKASQQKSRSSTYRSERLSIHNAGMT